MEYHKQWLFISTDHIVLCCTMLLCTTKAGWKCIVYSLSRHDVLFTHYLDMMYMMYCCIVIATTTVVTVPRALCQQLCTHYNYVAQECPSKANLYIPFNSNFNFMPCRLHPASNGNAISESHSEYEGHAHITSLRNYNYVIPRTKWRLERLYRALFQLYGGPTQDGTWP